MCFLVDLLDERQLDSTLLGLIKEKKMITIEIPECKALKSAEDELVEYILNQLNANGVAYFKYYTADCKEAKTGDWAESTGDWFLIVMKYATNQAVTLYSMLSMLFARKVIW